MHKIVAYSTTQFGLSSQERFFLLLEKSHTEIAESLERKGDTQKAQKVRDLTKIILAHKWAGSRIQSLLNHMRLNPQRLHKIMGQLLKKPTLQNLFMDYDKENHTKQYTPNKKVYVILNSHDEYDVEKHKNAPIQFISDEGSTKIKIDHLYADGDGVRQILLPLVIAYAKDIGWDILTLGQQRQPATNPNTSPDLSGISLLKDAQAAVLKDKFPAKLSQLYERIQPAPLSDSIKVSPDTIAETTTPIDVTQTTVPVSVGLLENIAKKLNWQNRKGAPLPSQVLEYAAQIALAICNNGKAPMGRAPRLQTHIKDQNGQKLALPAAYNATSAAVSISSKTEATLDHQKSIRDVMQESRINAGEIRTLQQDLGTFDIITVEEMSRQAATSETLMHNYSYPQGTGQTHPQPPYALYEINTMNGLIGGPPPLASGLLLSYYLTNSITPDCNYGKWEAHDEQGNTIYRPEIILTAKTPTGSPTSFMHIETRDISVKPEVSAKIGKILVQILNALEKKPDMTLQEIKDAIQTETEVTLSKHMPQGTKRTLKKVAAAGAVFTFGLALKALINK